MKHPTEPRFINKTDVLTTFDFIQRAMSKDLKDNRDTDEVKAKLSYLTNSYVSSYKLTKMFYGNVEFQINYQIIKIRRPDKENGVAIVDRWLYMCKMYGIVNDAFLKL